MIYDDYDVTVIEAVEVTHWTIGPPTITSIGGHVLKSWCLRDYIEALGWGQDEQYDVFI